MRKYTILAGTLLAGTLVFAQAPATPSGGDTNTAQSSTQGSDSSKPTAMKSSKKMDETFAKKAAEGGMAEVEMGKLAADKGNNPDVKAFGQRMVDDHTKANDKLKEAAGKSGIQLPSDLSAKDKAMKERMAKMSGDAFDRAYVNHMLADHKKDVADFQKEASGGKDDSIKTFASDTLPTLQDHLKQVQDIKTKMGGSKGAKSSDSSMK